MSVVVGVECAGGVWLAADSIVLHDGARDTSSGKIIDRGTYAIASVGWSRSEQVIRYHLDLAAPSASRSIEEWIVVSLVKELRDLAESFAPWPTEGDPEGRGFSLLIAARGELFELDSQYAAHRSPRGYQAIGVGADIAHGSLYSTKGQKPDERCRTAVEAAAEHSSQVSLPIEPLWVPA